MSRFTVLVATIAISCVAAPFTATAQRTTKPTKPTTAPSPAPASRGSSGSSGSSGSATTASVLGAVIDSLHDGPLSQAGVLISGLPDRHAVTTTSGAFRIDSIPPGRYTLELRHPVLDSLGIRVMSDTLTLAAGQVQTVELAVPSAATLTTAVCSAAKLRFGPGVVLGRVIDAETDEPAVGAEVSLAWTETEVNTSVGVRSTPRVRKATVGADGTYRICGVPPSFSGSLQASRGTAKTAEVAIDANERGLAIRQLYLPPAQTASASSAPASGSASAGDSAGAATVHRAYSATISGKVTNAGGVPVVGARISVQGTASTVVTKSDGTFTMGGVAPGTQAVLVRSVGYSPVELPVDVKTRGPNSLTVRLGRYTPQLSTVTVTAKTDKLAGTGFEHRRKMGMGHYLDQNDVDNAHPVYTSDLLRRLPGVYVVGSGQSASVYTQRGNGCVQYLVDRNPVAAAGQSIDDLVNARDIAAVEFYQTADVPLELTSGSNSGCALLVIWTRGEVKPDGKSR